MEKNYLLRSECEQRARTIAKELREISEDNKHVVIFGVPRGGIPAAYMVAQAYTGEGYTAEVTYDVALADVFVDDIIDNGATLARYQSKPFFALYDKRIDGSAWFVFPWERGEKEGTGAEDIVTRFLQYIGEDSKRKGLLETPQRVIKSWGHLYGGYNVKVADIFKTFDEPCDEMVILRNIEFYSMCEHHCLPFFGKVHVAYIPNGKVVGISKLARLVDCFSRRLQIQERMTQQITDTIDEYLKPIGCACFVEAQHLCMMARGVEKQNSVMITSSLHGLFKEKDAARLEFLLLNGRGGIHG